jgi:hypothetical protein
MGTQMKRGMIVAVCGGRDYNDRDAVFDKLTRIHNEWGITGIIQGGARGADKLGLLWASSNGVPHRTFEADWANKGRAAGPIRNQRMIKEGKPDLVVAFPGGRGTGDMVKRARAAGIEVLLGDTE